MGTAGFNTALVSELSFLLCLLPEDCVRQVTNVSIALIVLLIFSWVRTKYTWCYAPRTVLRYILPLMCHVISLWTLFCVAFARRMATALTRPPLTRAAGSWTGIDHFLRVFAHIVCSGLPPSQKPLRTRSHCLSNSISLTICHMLAARELWHGRTHPPQVPLTVHAILRHLHTGLLFTVSMQEAEKWMCVVVGSCGAVPRVCYR